MSLPLKNYIVSVHASALTHTPCISLGSYDVKTQEDEKERDSTIGKKMVVFLMCISGGRPEEEKDVRTGVRAGELKELPCPQHS